MDQRTQRAEDCRKTAKGGIRTARIVANRAKDKGQAYFKAYCLRFVKKKKAHWYDPETTIGLYESKTLAEWLEPFQPTAEEFQIIAQYENERKKLKESQTEDEYYSVEGRKWLIDEILKLNKQLQEQLGEERHKFYAEVREHETGYYKTWEVLTANGISEERVAEFRELADEFNQKMHGWPLFRGNSEFARPAPGDDFHISFDEKERLSHFFRDRIEEEFGKQVLDDILSLGEISFFMDGLDWGDNSIRQVSLMLNPKQQERLKTLYGVEFISKEKGIRLDKEMDRLEKREMEFMEKWVKHHAQQ